MLSKEQHFEIDCFAVVKVLMMYCYGSVTVSLTCTNMPLQNRRHYRDMMQANFILCGPPELKEASELVQEHWLLCSIYNPEEEEIKLFHFYLFSYCLGMMLS